MIKLSSCTNKYCATTSARNRTTRIVSFSIDDLEVNVGENLPVANKTNHLRKIFPNPFSQSTTLEWTLTQSCEVRIQIMDLNGKSVETPFRSMQQAGDYKMDYDVSCLSAGIYICQFYAGSVREIQKLVVVK